jgi:hypothetical protein
MVLTNNLKEILRENKMQSCNRHNQFNTMPKQVGVIASYWLAINTISLESDRTPSSGSLEDAM